MQTEENNIDAAAEALLASAGPERVRRFREKYGEAWISAQVPGTDSEPQANPCGAPLVDAGLEEVASASFGQNLPELLKALVAQMSPKLDAQGRARLAEALKAHTEGEAFRSKADEMVRTEPMTRLTRQLQTGVGNVKRRFLAFDPPVSPDDLRAALLFGTCIRSTFSLKGVPGVPREQTFVWATPLTRTRRRMLGVLVAWLLDGAAFARSMGSASAKDWQAAYLLAFRTIGGPNATAEQVARPFPQKTADRLVELITSAHYGLFADAATIGRQIELWGHA